jgi:DNA polymerase-3 subunit gamma/tau
MSYQVLARKWRPANFTQMVGQEHVLQALCNALDSNRLHHAYLFSGTRGVGKTTIARIFAKCLNCEQGISAEPCGECSSCQEIDQGRSLDLIEIDAASRTGVDDMRELLDNVQYAPTRSRFKIYLIDEVHMLSRHSFNALLKTLEEPPPHIKFLLATTDPQKLPVTVLSRCLQFNLKRMSKAQILSQLQFLTDEEKVGADETALLQLASAADGSMRDALSLLDQAIGYGAGAVRQQAVEAMLGSISRDYLVRLLDALAQQQAAEVVDAARQVIEHNPDYQRVCAEMISLFQQVALYQCDARLVLQDEFDENLLQNYSAHWSPETVQLYYQILLQGRQDLLISPDEAAGFEMLMLRLIAFSPQEAAPETVGEVKKKPDLTRPAAPVDKRKDSSGDPRTAPQAPAAEKSIRPQAVIPGDAGTEASEPVAPRPAPQPATDAHTQPAAETSDAPAARSSEAEAVATTANETVASTAADDERAALETEALSSTSLDWPILAYDLGLSGIAQQLVANSELVFYAENRLQLQLPRELHDLVNDLTQAEILQALQQKLGVSLRLEMKSAERMAGQTPLQAKLLREQQERCAAITAIREDSLVRKLQQVFEVELDESSVVKTESKR